MQRSSIYTFAQLDRLLDPRSVAIVGVSENPASFGARTLAALDAYDGEIHPVNAKYGQVAGRACHASLRALPAPPDCVVAAVPRQAVHEVVAEAVAVGAGGVVVYASGFAETGLQEREELQRSLTELVQGTGTRLLGPNCLGLLAGHSALQATFTHVPHPPRPARAPGIGLVSQSGALGMALLQAAARGVEFSHMIAPGNACDVDVADLIGYLAEDEHCAVIACVFEGTSSPARLLQAGELARRRRKPVLVCKIASGEEGAAAAMSHTGSVAGSDAAWQALFERAGFIVVDHFDALVETASFFRKAPAWRGSGAAVISPSGGAGILCADAAERCGVPLPQPSAAATALLRSVVPEFGAARNPCDVTAQVINDAGSLARCAAALLGDEGVGALVVPHITAYPEATQRTLAIGQVARDAGAAYCVVWMSEWLEGPGAEDMERDPTAAVFRSPERCFAALAAWNRFQSAGAAMDGVEPAGGLPGGESTAAARAALADTPPGTVLSERPAKRLLAMHGIAVVPERLARSAAEAADAADALGYPVVLKVESAAIPHKTEAGVVRLNLADAAAVEAAYEDVMARALRHAEPGRIDGVLVQPMVRGGVEILVGGRVDPDFGPMVVVGLGGVFVELLRDTVSALAPISPAMARGLLERLRGRRLLDGFRGSAPVNVDRLAETIAAVSRFLASHADLLDELDINPLICEGDRVVAVDALIVRNRNHHPNEETP